MVDEIFDSIERMATADYKATCGHMTDARKAVYYHGSRIATACQKCDEKAQKEKAGRV